MFGTVPAHQYAACPSLQDDFFGALAVVDFAGFVFDDLDTLEKAHTADVSHEGELSEVLEVFAQVQAGLVGILLQFLGLDDVEDSAGCGHRHGIPSISTEKLDIPLFKGLSNLLATDHSRHRKPIAHRLTTSNNIRHHPIVLKRPEMRPHPAKPRLHLIGNPHHLPLFQHPIHLLIEILKRYNLACTALHHFADECASLLCDDGI